MNRLRHVIDSLRGKVGVEQVLRERAEETARLQQEQTQQTTANWHKAMEARQADLEKMKLAIKRRDEVMAKLQACQAEVANQLSLQEEVIRQSEAEVFELRATRDRQAAQVKLYFAGPIDSISSSSSVPYSVHCMAYVQ